MMEPISWCLTKYLLNYYTIPYKNLKIDDKTKNSAPSKKYDIPNIMDIIN